MQSIINHHIDAANHCKTAAKRVQKSLDREPCVRTHEKTVRISYLYEQEAKHEAMAAKAIEFRKELRRLQKLDSN